MKTLFAALMIMTGFCYSQIGAAAGSTDMNVYEVTAIELKQDLPGWAGESVGNVIRVGQNCSIRKHNSLLAKGAKYDDSTNKISMYASLSVTTKQDGSGSVTSYDQSISTLAQNYPFILSCGGQKLLSMAEFQANFANHVALTVKPLNTPQVAQTAFGGTSLFGIRCDGKKSGISYNVYSDFAKGWLINVYTSPNNPVSRKGTLLRVRELAGEYAIAARAGVAPAPGETIDADMELHLKKNGVNSSIDLLQEPGKGSIPLSCNYAISLF